MAGGFGQKEGDPGFWRAEDRGKDGEDAGNW